MTTKERRELLDQGNQKINELEHELAHAQNISRRAKRRKDISQEELSRVASTGISFVQVIDDLGMSFQQAIVLAATRLSKRS